MTLREQRDQQNPAPQIPIAAGEPGDDTQSLRDESEVFLAAADDAINRALSRNSSEFLAQNRQMGGQ